MKERRLKSHGLIWMILAIGFRGGAAAPESFPFADEALRGSSDAPMVAWEHSGSTVPSGDDPSAAQQDRFLSTRTRDSEPCRDDAYQVTDVMDRLAPISLILTPEHGGFVRGSTVEVSGVAAAPSGIARVELSTDGGETWTQATGQENWCVSWSPGADGEYSLSVRAMDVTGLLESSIAGISVIVDNTPPTAEFISPRNTTQIQGDTVIVTGTATDAGAGVDRVEVSDDAGATWSPAYGTSRWSYTWTPPSSGEWTLIVRATDKVANQREESTRTQVAVDSLRFSLPNGRTYPVLWSSQAISASAPISRIETFLPTFSHTREVVNPALPIIDGKTLTFDAPGEYYLIVNGGHAIKVLVLAPAEAISSHVVRIFNFFVANMVQSSEDDYAFYSNRGAFAHWWFHSVAPARLLCGPTADVFQMVVRDALSLPTRKVTFPGVTRARNRIERTTHNVLEVYLPDVRKWTLFDINEGFVSRWMDAFDLVDFSRANTNAATASGRWETGGAIRELDIPTDTPIPYLAKDWSAYTGKPFSRHELSSIPRPFVWKENFRFYYSGLAYWGGGTEIGNPLSGTEFLPGQYIFANRHSDRALEEEVISWIESFGISVTRVSQRALLKMLAAGFHDEIEAKAWLRRIPVAPDANNQAATE